KGDISVSAAASPGPDPAFAPPVPRSAAAGRCCSRAPPARRIRRSPASTDRVPMASHNLVADAMRRAIKVFQRRPDHGLHEDATATIIWQGGTRMSACHASGASIDTDMPVELGGGGDCVSPGWLFRSGLGSCAATVIYMTAAL